MQRAQNMRQKEKKGKYVRQQLNANTGVKKICKACGQEGHSTSASKKCMHHRPNNDERITMQFGKEHERFTHAVPFDNAVKAEHRQRLKQAACRMSSWLSHMMLRAAVVVNGYFIWQGQNGIPTYMFSQNFWYSVCQLILGLDITNINTKFPSDFTGEDGFWTWFSALHPNINYPLNVTGYSDILSAACQEMATVYTNNIVENFQPRVVAYIQHKLDSFVPVSCCKL